MVLKTFLRPVGSKRSEIERFGAKKEAKKHPPPPSLLETLREQASKLERPYIGRMQFEIAETADFKSFGMARKAFALSGEPWFLMPCGTRLEYFVGWRGVSEQSSKRKACALKGDS